MVARESSNKLAVPRCDRASVLIEGIPLDGGNDKDPGQRPGSGSAKALDVGSGVSSHFC